MAPMTLLYREASLCSSAISGLFLGVGGVPVVGGGSLVVGLAEQLLQAGPLRQPGGDRTVAAVQRARGQVLVEGDDVFEPGVPKGQGGVGQCSHAHDTSVAIVPV